VSEGPLCKTAFVNLRIEITSNKTWMKHIQTTKNKNPYQPKDFQNLKKKICEPEVSSLCQIFVI
jgi:hypothetical protein